MGVRIRRIYDITTIFDGIGLFKKVGKNQVVWIYSSVDNLKLFN